MSKCILWLVALMSAAVWAQTNDGAVAGAYPWELPTDAETACGYVAVPDADQLTPADVRTVLADRMPVRLPVNVEEAYAASALLPNGAYCLAVWTSPLASGQHARFTFDWKGVFSRRMIENGVTHTQRPGNSSATTVPLDRRPVFIECSRDPARWVTSSMFRATLPYEVGARVVLMKGNILLGVTNYLDRPVAGSMRVVGGDGVRLLVNTFGFTVPARGVMLRYLPVRDATKDEPSIDCIVAFAGAMKGHVRQIHVDCRSGALFRNPEMGKIVGALPEFHALKPAVEPDGGLAFTVAGQPLVRRMRFSFDGGDVAWQGTSVGCTGTVSAGGVRIASLARKVRLNDRGDGHVYFGYDMKAQGPANAQRPSLVADLAWSVASNAMVAARVNGAFKFGLLDAAHVADTIQQISGPAVEDWSIMLPNDWLTFNLDSTELTVTRTSEAPDADLRLTFRSRSTWPVPAPAGRSGNIQFFVHFPVEKKATE